MTEITAKKNRSIQNSLHSFGTVLLIGVIGLVFTMGLTPKQNYRYPIHVDEWSHYALAQATLDSEKLVYPNPIYGEDGPSGLGVNLRHHESGFHVLLANTKLITGVSWDALFRYLPPFFFATTAFLAYLIGRRKGFGLEAAALVALMPTTLRFLGPGFLVPMAVGLLMMPAALLVMSRLRFSWPSISITVVILGNLFFTHPASAIFLVIVVSIHVALLLLRSGDHDPGLVSRVLMMSVGSIALGFFAAIVSNSGFSDVVARFVSSGSVPTLPKTSPELLLSFGILPVILFILGTALLMRRRTWEEIALASSALAVLLIVAIYHAFELGNQTFADRGLLLSFVFMALAGGYGLAEVRHKMMRFSRRRTKSMVVAVIPVIASLGIIGVILSIGLPSRFEEPYYRLIDDRQFRDSQWIRDFTNNDYSRMLQDPAWGLAAAPLSGLATYSNSSVLFESSPKRIEAAYRILQEGPVDTSWFIKNDVDVLYRARDVSNPSFNEPRPGIFLIRKPEVAKDDRSD